MSQRRLLVTGGAGFIGGNFVHYWKKKYSQDEIIILDALTYAGNKVTIHNALKYTNCQFIQGNIVDYDLVVELLEKHSIDTIVNFAAESHVDRSIVAPDEFVETNIVGTYQLLKAAKQVWLDGSAIAKHRFHHVSTDEVYGELSMEAPAFTEQTAYDPRSPYSASKASSDHMVNAYHHTYGLKTTISNCSNNYGPYHYPEKLIPLIITNILQDKSLPVYGEGLQVRDWLYVEDHCFGIEKILQQGISGQVYNIGGENEWTNIDIVRKICQLMDEQFQSRPEWGEKYPQAVSAKHGQSEQLIEFVADRLGHDFRYAINPKKVVNELGYQVKKPFDMRLKETIIWYLQNDNWWAPLLPS